MDARRLLHWGDLEEQRRRRHGGGLSPWIYAALATALLGFLMARGMRLLGASISGDATPLSASTLWLAAVGAGHVVVLFGAPFRMYWRHDSAFLGRCAVRGNALYIVALVRSVRAALRVTLPCIAAALVFAAGPYGDVEIALRHVLLAAIAGLWAGLLGPSVALAAGAVVASNQAQALLGSLGGDVQAPRTSWLGILPGLAGTALLLLLIAAASWTRGGNATPVGDPALLLALAGALPVVAVLAALARADGVMLDATREVAALDQERLAHIDLTTPSFVERTIARNLPGVGAGLVLEKDASLARRRYPIPYFLGVVGMIALLILAASQPDDLLVWAGVIAAGLGAYGVVMAQRSRVPPIEYPRFLRTLPVARRAALTAKRARLVAWLVVYTGPGSAAVIARSDEPVLAALVLGAITLIFLLAGSRTADAPSG